MSEVRGVPAERPEEPDQTDDGAGRRIAKLTEIVAGWARQQSSSSQMDFASKVTSEHVTKSLEVVDAHDQRVLEDRKDERADRRDARVKGLFRIGMLILAGLGIVAMLVFSGNAELIGNALEWITLLGIGAVGGYGYGFTKR